jgi:NADPH-ferrihemoprotein reductase
VYVQHLLKEHGSFVWDLLQHKKGYFYICGDAKHMAVDVTKTLTEIAESFGEMDSIQSSLWIKGLRSKGRFLEDVWS